MDHFNYAEFLEYSPDMFAAVNLETGQIVYCNTSLPRKLGYTKRDLLNQPVHIICSSNNHFKISSQIESLKNNCDEISTELVLNTREGVEIFTTLKASRFFINGSGEPIGNFIWREVVPENKWEVEYKIHKKVMEVLEASKRFYVSRKGVVPLFEKMLSSILEISGSEYGFIGEVLYKKDGSPYLKSQFISDISWDVDSKALYDQHLELGFEFYNLDTLFGRVLKTGEILISNDPANDPRGGGVPEGHPALNCFLGIPIKFENDFVGMVGLANKPSGYSSQDIETLEPFVSACGFLLNSYGNYREKVAAESENEEILRRLKISNQYLEELAQVAAHDLRAPLRKIRNFCYFIERDRDQLPENTAKYLRKIEKVAEDGEKLIDSVLEYSKPDFSEAICEDVDLNQVVTEAFASVQEEHDVPAEFHCDPLPHIMGNRIQISQVFYNLISNSFRYRQKQRVLKIEISTTIANDSEWVLEIRDNGIGFSPDAEEIVFNPFQRLYDLPTIGSGLGLSICRKIISAHKGRILAQGNPGQGATFLISFPNEIKEH